MLLILRSILPALCVQRSVHCSLPVRVTAAHSNEYSCRGGAYRRHVVQYVSKWVPSGSIVPSILVLQHRQNVQIKETNT